MWGSQSWLQPPFEAALRSGAETDLVFRLPHVQSNPPFRDFGWQAKTLIQQGGAGGFACRFKCHNQGWSHPAIANRNVSN